MLWIDKQVLQSFNVTTAPRGRSFFTMTAHVYFLVVLLYLLPGLYVVSQGNWFFLIQISIMGGGGAVLGAILKAIVKRPRPHNLVTYLGKADSSFPSSHTLIAIGLAILDAILLPSWYIAFFVVAILVGLGRMYTQMHYLTDVFGGAIIGGLCAALIIYFS
jgi:undecaprenyl-diphosphatase